jgi:hypothetical protein
MVRRQDGFSLVELMVTMLITVFAIAAAVGIFVPLLTQFKQQSKIAETNIEGIVGLELLRVDIEGAGYGLPWFSQNSLNYSEAAAAPASNYNDSPNLPRAIFSGNNVTGLTNIMNNTDYLVIKSMVVGRSDIGQRWSYVTTGSTPKVWTSDYLNNGDRVVVIKPKVSEKILRELVMNGSTYYTQFSTGGLPAAFSPQKTLDTYLIYGVDDGNLRMPFNRADYFVSTQNVPTRCAPQTGVLTKSVVNHAAGTFTGGVLPLLDCVADMQVTYWLDTSSDGIIDWPPLDDISDKTVYTAETIRNQLMEIRVYIVAHEGQRDPNFDFSMNNTRNPYFSATEITPDGSSRTINFVNLKNLVGDPDYKYYRWKLYTLVVKPQNLR